jgi:hypothetical protein
VRRFSPQAKLLLPGSHEKFQEPARPGERFAGRLEPDMNTANLQLEGLYAAMAAIIGTLQQKGVLSPQEIERCLLDAEEATARDRPHELSAAHIDAIRFPFRYLRAASKGEGAQSFAAITAQIGMTKDDSSRGQS